MIGLTKTAKFGKQMATSAIVFALYSTQTKAIALDSCSTNNSWGNSTDCDNSNEFDSISGPPYRDSRYPGTAVLRMFAVRNRVGKLTTDDLSEDWFVVRQKLLWAGGLRDIVDAPPGQGNTAHAFNDHNHCDLTTMLVNEVNNQHDGVMIPGIMKGNMLGKGIKIASLPLGEEGSGSWTTCMQGCNNDPPRDVAHLQFSSRIAFKLVWCPGSFKHFVLVDDSGCLLAIGNPTGDSLPKLEYRMANYEMVRGSKYGTEAEKCREYFEKTGW